MKHLTALVCVGFALLGGNAFAGDLEGIPCVVTGFPSEADFTCQAEGVSTPYYVKMAGIHAPDPFTFTKAQITRDPENYPYFTSKGFLSTLIQNKAVLVNGKKELSNLIIQADVLLPDAGGIKNIAVEMVKNGYAKSTEEKPKYKKWEEYAKKNNKGLWPCYYIFGK